MFVVCFIIMGYGEDDLFVGYDFLDVCNWRVEIFVSDVDGFCQYL